MREADQDPIWAGSGPDLGWICFQGSWFPFPTACLPLAGVQLCGCSVCVHVLFSSPCKVLHSMEGPWVKEEREVGVGGLRGERGQRGRGISSPRKTLFEDLVCSGSTVLPLLPCAISLSLSLSFARSSILFLSLSLYLFLLLPLSLSLSLPLSLPSSLLLPFSLSFFLSLFLSLFFSFPPYSPSLSKPVLFQACPVS